MQKTDIVAVDGGGTKTLLLRVRPDATIAVMRKAGGSNPFDVPEWREVITALYAGQDEYCCAAAFGMAGFGESGRLSGELAQALSATCSAPHVIHNDVDMACRGAFLNGPGILLLSGTGSMAWGLDASGRTGRVGGWGSLFGDEGSAYWIGRCALSRLAQSLDGRMPDRDGFVARFAAQQGWPTTPEACGAALQEWYANLIEPRPVVAALAADIGRLAAEGCAVSVAIFEDAASHLARHIHALRDRMGAPDLAWSYAGGTMRSEILREAVSRQCGLPCEPGLPPIGGAVLVAAAKAGWNTDASFVARLSSTLAEAGLN
ncbi:N-acetylglucosamine kinase [Asaia krungthepensis]|uniref:N-acetylglucosamine kinase n=1 Tax=Asaia krungthepensis NRIC 0535 TaxID=1307925 RepID=A0ABQ0Q6J9_9PROT|nr:BadF/BadG/BcrA/BcrD ATPase family protein [Asaia krungthepensis]GBQ93658.1 N-acetylglucosamine kinase [Asaia krungthepensis NRIC 0535]